MSSNLVQKTCVEDYLCITNIKRKTFNLTWKLHDVNDIHDPVTSIFPIRSDSGIQWKLKLNFQPAKYTSFIFVELSALSARELPMSVSIQMSAFNFKTDKYKIVHLASVAKFEHTHKPVTFTHASRDSLLGDDRCFLKEGTLTLFFEIMILSPLNTTIETSFKTASTPVLQFSEDFALFTSVAPTDVVFEVSGTEIAAHKGILSARSSVFRAMFEHEMKETKSNRVQVQDIDAEVLNELMRFIYTGKIPNLDKIAAKMMAAADKYDLETLKKACEKFMYSELTAEIAVETLNIADKYDAQELKAKTLQYIFLNIKDVAKTDEWKQAVQTYPNLALEVLQMEINR